MSIHWPIIRRLLSHPLRTAAIDDNRTYRSIDMLVGALHVAGHLERVCQSDTVGVLLPTGGAFPVAALGAWMLGKTVVPLNYLLKREELAYVVENCETDTIVSAGAMLEYLGHRPPVEHLLELDKLGFRGVPELRWPAMPGDDALAVILYTSGTSGRPKGVMLSHGNITANIEQCRVHAEFDSRDVLLGVLPQFHSFGLTVLTLLPLTVGCRAVYSARFVPQRIVKLLREHRPTAVVAIPSMYNALMHVKDAGPDDFKSLRYTVSGGEPLPDAVFQGFRERFGVTLNEGYGLTETSPVTNWCRPREWRAHSVGPALPGVIERIVEPGTGRDLPPGEDGEVFIGGPNLMQGYFKLPEETRAAIDDRRFLHTGDIGRMDRDGHLYITGRIKEMLIIGGENVFPREIEEVLLRHPAVNGAGVIGMTDPMRGEVPAAFVELKEGAATDEKALIVWCREHLAGYKVPAVVRIVAALPRNATGKVVRRELKGLLGAAKQQSSKAANSEGEARDGATQPGGHSTRGETGAQDR